MALENSDLFVVQSLADDKFYKLSLEDLITRIEEDGVVESVNGQTGTVSLGLLDLDDIEDALPDDGDILTWDSANEKWVFVTPASTEIAIEDLTNVDSDAVFFDDCILRYDATEGVFKAEALPPPVEPPVLSVNTKTGDVVLLIQDLDNVALTPFQDNDVLVYDAVDSEFKPEQIPAAPVQSVNGQTGDVELGVGDLSDFNSTTFDDEDILVWDDNAGKFINRPESSGTLIIKTADGTSLGTFSASAVTGTETVITLPTTDQFVTEAPEDGESYIRQNGAWVTLDGGFYAT